MAESRLDRHGDSQSDLEEGEVESEQSSDDDYSPGSLVIDTAGDTSPHSSGPPTPPISLTKHNLQYDTHPLLGPSPSNKLASPVFSTLLHSQTQNIHYPNPHSNTGGSADSAFSTPSSQPLAANLPPESLTLSQPHTYPPPHPHTFTSPQPLIPITQPVQTSSSPLVTNPSDAVIPTQGADGTGEGQSEEREQIVSFVTKIGVASEGSPPIDTICVYHYQWCDVTIDILTRIDKVTLIPIKNVYNRAIPGLKQNVLSARISKLGIRSLVLPEPYVSTLKKLNMGLTGSSHYITISDFVKICTYFRHPPPKNIVKFDFITSAISSEEVVKIFNDPSNEASQKLLSQLSAEAEVKGLNSSSGSGSKCGSAGTSGRGNKRKESEGSSIAMDETYNPSEVDTRRFILSDGRHIFLFVREGVAFIPNPELAKILPAVSRTAMEHIRSSYGITVYQASKAEIGVLKFLNVVSVKAGRTLVYRMSDVAKMFQHWKLKVPERIMEICEGKLPDDKVTVNIPPGHHWSLVQPTSDHEGTVTPSSRKRQRHAHSLKKASPTVPTHQSPLWRTYQTVSDSTHYKNQYENSDQKRQHSGMGLSESAPYSGVGMKQRVQNSSESNPMFGNVNLTPEQFQQPVNMLSSMLMGENSNSYFPGHVTSTSDHVSGSLKAEFMSPSGAKLEDMQLHVAKRRRSLTTASPLDDQNLEYSSLLWGEQTLALLCPANDGEPHLAIPELVKKVFHYRSYVSAQRRSDLGVVTLPASSLQIHALRARDSLDSIPGNTRLISLSDAVKLAVDGNFQIPGTVIQLLKKYCKEPLDSILNPVSIMSAPPAGSSFRSIAPKEPTQEVVKTSIGPSAHPDIINLGPEYRLSDGIMCQVRWNDFKLVVYKTNKKVNYMGLYQIYEILFQEYVNRMNFKVRMRKLDIRSIRAPPAVRLKLIELNALPPNCPVCGLVKVSEVEHLAKSYGVVLPAVFTEELITAEDRAGKVYKQTKQGPSRSGPQKVSINKKGKSKHNVFMYKFDDSQNASSKQFLNEQPNMPVPFMPGGQGTNQSYVVPYLTSSRNRLGTSSNNLSMTSPGVVMTSLGTMATDQIRHSDSNTLIISIPRNLTPYKVTSQQVFNINPFETRNSLSKPRMKFGGSRGKVLQNLAKKITQKSRKFATGGVAGLTPGFTTPATSIPTIEGSKREQFSSTPGGRVCPTCNQVNTLSKKRCQNCNNFLVGRSCTVCGTMNHNKNKECSKCGVTLLFEWQREDSSHTQNDLSSSFVSPRKEGSVGGASDSSSHPTSPLSPKFSAPPIRNAVLKNMFPQSTNRSSEDTPISLSASSSSSAAAAGQQVTTKTVFSGNLASSRKCLECGQLNSRMAKKCLQCRSHLQGRPCHRCGRPNLNHVTECYKCGATLPVHANKWVYAGSHSGRAYKTVQDPGERILKSRAPISCIRCHKLRSSGNFKCGRCGDVFKTTPLVNPPWPEDDYETNKTALSLTSSLKKRKVMDQRMTETERSSGDQSVMEQFGTNIFSLAISDKLTPLILEVESESREKIHSAEEELEAAENEYQVFLVKKEAIEKSYQEAQLELNVLIAETESHNHKLVELVEQEKQANELVESLPNEISALMERIKSVAELLTVH